MKKKILATAAGTIALSAVIAAGAGCQKAVTSSAVSTAPAATATAAASVTQTPAATAASSAASATTAAATAASTAAPTTAATKPAATTAAPSSTAATTAAQTHTLTQDELYDIAYEFNEIENNGFLLSSYRSIDGADLGEILYNGAGIDSAMTQQERQDYEKATGTEISTDIVKIKASAVRSFVKSRMGLKFGTDISLGWRYLEAYDSYYSEHGDTNQTKMVCISGEKKSDGTYVVRYVRSYNSAGGTGTAVFTRSEGVLHFISNQEP